MPSLAVKNNDPLPFRPPRRNAKRRTLPLEDQPRERLLRSGGGVLSDAELLAVLLRRGICLDSLQLAQDLIYELGGLHGLIGADRRDLNLPGIGPAGRAVLLAAVELGRRLARSRMPRRDLLDQPEAVASYLGLRYGQADQEVMGALYLDVRKRLIREGDSGAAP